ncbi:MAG: thioredoxin family protein [Sphingomonadaceae bacterium]|nr:thioredoxin family protein [Sphingomonadaceae bacterium]
MKRGFALAGLALLACSTLAGCAQSHASPAPASHGPRYPAGKLYDPQADAEKVLAATRASAVVGGKPLLVVFGANWCHDSRALAEALTQGETGAFAQEHFEVLFIDVGTPQIGKGRNLGLATELGVEDIEGTPTLVALGPDGALLNGDSAKGWRNAASRSEAEIMAALEGFVAAGEYQ